MGYLTVAFGQSANAVPTIPVPSGPYGIGRIGYDWIDPSRADQYFPTPDKHRELMVYLWYPTATKSAGNQGPYLPGAQQMDVKPEVRDQMRQNFGDNWQTIVSGAIYSHAVERAPLAGSPQQFPLVIFSHGLGSTGFAYTCLIEFLVSHGYVVASIEHTYVALAVQFPDGRVILRHNDPAPPELNPEQKFKWMTGRVADQITEGAADVRFVLNRLFEENSHRERFALAGQIDLNRIAAMGHSAGAEFAARACQLDDRIKACVDLDGEMLPVAALPQYPDHATLKQPLLLLEAYQPESQMVGTPAEQAAYLKKKKEQLQACPRGGYDVVLRPPGLAHPGFSDVPLLFDGKDGYPARERAIHNLNLIEQYVIDFLGKALNHQDAVSLNSGATAEATVQPLPLP